MNQQGINRTGLGTALEADEARKSNLILEAQLLREQARADGQSGGSVSRSSPA